MRQLEENKLTRSGQRSLAKLAYLKIYGQNLQIIDKYMLPNT